MSKNNFTSVIVGLGKTGLACARYLAKQNIPFAVVDSRQNPPGIEALKKTFPDVLVALGEFNREIISQADTLIMSPGVSLKEPVIAEQIARGVEAVGDIELFAQAAQAPIIAITGSNGKTTVTSLMGEMIQQASLQVQVCGNIGQPVLDLLDQPVPDFYVLELSSFQLETTHSLKAAAAVVLNISADHMDRYDNVVQYRQAKQKIYQDCEQAVINWDDPDSWKGVSFVKPPIAFSLKKQGEKIFSVIENNGEKTFVYEDQLLMPVKKMHLQGYHHQQNALAAMALGQAVGLPVAPMLKALEKFQGLAHRCQFVREYGGAHWYNDSKATNVGAAEAAILTLGEHKTGQLILIAGGDAKQADITPLVQSVTQYVDHIILMGQDAPLFKAALIDSAPLLLVDSMEEAVTKAAQLAKAGDQILLSPACASFDMFNNFEHRGEMFMQAVNKLME